MNRSLISLTLLLSLGAQAATPTSPELCPPPDSVWTFTEEGTSRRPAEELESTGGLPPKLSRQIPVTAYFGCRRAFRWKEKTYLADSYYKNDAGRLKLVVRDTPDALRAIDRYQNNQTSARIAAYVGSVGLMVAVASLFINTSDPTWNRIRNIGLVGGLSLAGGSFLVNFTILRTNESNIKDAVQYYNGAHPQTPIDLQFSTSVLF